MSTEVVDQPSKKTVRVRQGTGPTCMVSVLFVSLIAAAVAGAVIVAYFVLSN